MGNLSEAAIDLLRLHHDGAVEIDDSNLEAHRELEAAGLVVLCRPFTGPRRYIPTKLGWKLKEVLARITVPSP